ncbi:helix-turn-helix domain-containing protein [Embleya sp. NPDC020886]|uniref:helix-turn-helix domain-containing protein n=1 Tax=Embleya sp. NPDC020886 TaxID=3363980 RepID=UPI0037B59D9B
MAAIPTVRRRMLGLELRKLRCAAELTAEEASDRMGWHPTKMSRIEYGRTGLKSHDLARVLDIYGVVDVATKEALTELARHSRLRVWWAPYSDVVSRRYADYLAFEAEATSARSHQVTLVPGLLQTPDYARTVTRSLSPVSTPSQVDALVDVRLARQAATLSRSTPLELWAIVDESALRRAIGGPATMRRQLQHLLAVSEQPNITLQVLPFASGAHAGLLGSFVILEFPIPGDLDVVYVEEQTSNLFIERDDDLKTYSSTFDLLRAAAADVEPSRDLMHTIAKDLK